MYIFFIVNRKYTMTELIKKQDHIKIISQGAYGCIFENENKNKPKSKEEYIIKIQKKEETSENETLIGKKIMNIKNYKNYFAPILETENINISSLDDFTCLMFLHLIIAYDLQHQ